VKKNIAVVFFIAVLAILAGCQTMSTQRIDTGQAIDIGSNWNDTDSRLVAEKMINEVLKRPWLNEYYNKHSGKKPVIIIGSVKNRSHEHININTFIRNLEAAMVNSGTVNFVAGKDERDELRKERVEQASHASEDTAKSAGEEIGADFMLKGELNSIINKDAGKMVKFYQVNLYLIDIEKNIKVWIGEEKIKKLLKQKKFKF
jgi:penicillin-binding protein activator